MDDSKLEPCGRCGGKATWKHNLSPAQWIECTGCGLKVSAWDETWNEVARILRQLRLTTDALEVALGSWTGTAKQRGEKLIEANRVLLVTGPDGPINPADVLAYIDEWKGQENNPEEVRDFVQTMAQMIADGKTMRDVQMSDFVHFAEWVAERR